MIQALMLKLAALSLLLLLGQNPNLPEDFRTQATVVANQALAVADAQLSSTSTPAVDPVSPPSTPSVPISPAPTTGSSTSNNVPAPMPPVSKAHIEIISPIPGKGLGRQYKAAPQIVGEENYIELGAIVYDDNGDPTNQPTVQISATDESQNKTLAMTGDVTPVYVDGSKRAVPVYTFHYEFRTAGQHTITFATNGMTKSVSVDVQ